MFKVQSLVFPHLGFPASEELYVRQQNHEVSFNLKEEILEFEKRGRVSFDTYFNSVSIGVWKKNCRVDDIGINLCGEGDFIVRFGIHRIGHAQKWLEELRVSLTEDSVFFPCSKWRELDDGMLFVYLESISGGTVHSGAWVTTSPPVRDVKLGIVITHFDRKNYVVPAIKRIKDKLLDDRDFSNKVELVVVDNSRNLTAAEADGATLIPNKNLGGSGGFMRGLLHLKDNHGFTHCLFMDDDASCEIESIRRAYTLLAYTNNEKMAVAGSLLRELESYRLFEKGALYNGVCIPLKSGMDMRSVNDLLYAELIDRTPHYGGWWFFSFQIDQIKEWAFPFFVRGDDSRFSIVNNFDIVTSNGISCWGDDFAYKSGVLPTYLDARYHILHLLNIYNKKYSDVEKICDHFVLKQLYSYNYSSAKAARFAVQHVMKGPDFFLRHMDMSELRGEIAQFASSEKMQPIDRRQWAIHYADSRESKFRAFIRKITLNGFLLPTFMLKNHGVLFQHKGFMANLKEVFGWKEVIYEYEPMRRGYIARHDKNAFFKEFFTYRSVMKNFKKQFPEVKKMWEEGFKKMTTEDFWRDVYPKN